MFCTNCGAENEERVHYCYKCGERVRVPSGAKASTLPTITFEPEAAEPPRAAETLPLLSLLPGAAPGSVLLPAPISVDASSVAPTPTQKDARVSRPFVWLGGFLALFFALLIKNLVWAYASWGPDWNWISNIVCVAFAAFVVRFLKQPRS